MKKILCLVLALVMIIGMVGCGKKESNKLVIYNSNTDDWTAPILEAFTKEKNFEAEHYMVQEAMNRGLLIGGSKYLGLGNVVKIKPPAIITYEELDHVLDVFEELFAECDKKF